MLPVAAWFVLREPSTLPVVVAHAKLWALVPLLGVVSAVALALYMAASRLLPMGLFGLLTYVEPVLLVLVALLLGETVAEGSGRCMGWCLPQWPSWWLTALHACCARRSAPLRAWGPCFSARS